MVSTMANRVLTITDIEKKINAWVLDNTTDITMYRSVTALVDLLRRSMEHRNRDEPIKYPELFRQAITRIQREKIPKMIHDNLNEARLRIRDTDPVPELNRILLGALNRYIGMKPPKQNTLPNLKQLTTPKVYALDYQPQSTQITQVATPSPTQGNPGNPGKKNQNQQKKPQGGDKNEKKVSTPVQVAQTDSRNDQKQKMPFKKFFFVKPWPKYKPYLSRNGNKVSQECEKHFEGHCFRCGHNSHTHDRCRVYPDKTACITLCSCCMQGFHEVCKRKWAKEESVAKQLTHQMNQLSMMYGHFAQFPPPQYMVTEETDGN